MRCGACAGSSFVARPPSTTGMTRTRAAPSTRRGWPPPSAAHVTGAGSAGECRHELDVRVARKAVVSPDTRTVGSFQQIHLIEALTHRDVIDVSRRIMSILAVSLPIKMLVGAGVGHASIRLQVGRCCRGRRGSINRVGVTNGGPSSRFDSYRPSETSQVRPREWRQAATACPVGVPLSDSLATLDYAVLDMGRTQAESETTSQ